MEPVFIESEQVRLGVLPEYGARVVSLLDRQSGRDWIAGGGLSRDVDEDAAYGGAEAVGWDECFPTVSPWDATGTTWARRLRDHGDLWGRPWTIDQHSPNVLTTNFATAAFRFSRTLSVAGPTTTAHYVVTNPTTQELPYLWALHGLLAVSAEDRIVLPDVTEAAATFLSLAGVTLAAEWVNWPETGSVLPFPLDRVQPASVGFAGKLYASRIAAHRAFVGHGDQWLAIGWDENIDDLGIWLNYGGWPKAPGGHHIALEPTTASADDLGTALQAGAAAHVAPGATVEWTVTLTLARSAL